MKFNNEEGRVLEGFSRYKVYCDGRIWNTKYNSWQKPWSHTVNGYTSLYVKLWGDDGVRKTYKLHRVVAFTFLPPPPTDKHVQINHIDGDSINNYYTNLEWATRSQNQRHAIRTGLKGKGDKLYNSQLTEGKVHEICKKLQEGVLVNDLSTTYGVSKDIIRKIKAGDTYFHIRQLYTLDHNYKFNYSEATIHWVCKQIGLGLGDREVVEISTNPNLTIIEVKRIRYKIRYSYISDKYF